MPQDIDMLRSKANAGIKALQDQTPRQREQTPTGSYGTAYNKFHGQVVEALPQLSELMPPHAEVVDDPHVGQSCRTSYSEFFQYYMEIRSLIDRAAPSEPVRVMRG